MESKKESVETLKNVFMANGVALLERERKIRPQRESFWPDILRTCWGHSGGCPGQNLRAGPRI